MIIEAQKALVYWLILKALFSGSFLNLSIRHDLEVQ